MLFLNRMCFAWVIALLCAVGPVASAGPYSPAGGQSGSTAIAVDDPGIVEWAAGCTVVRGLRRIDIPGNGYSFFGAPANALERPPADDTLDCVSLGQGGTATVTFDRPIANGPGDDFAVFSNGFAAGWIKPAFVEVSSNGTDFVRFPSVSLTPTAKQVQSFDTLDPTNLYDLAGKDPVGYGTPLDLGELAGLSPLLDINAVTQVRLVDAVGCIQDAYARYDSLNNKVNGPWPAPSAAGSEGFCLAGVGVIHAVPEPGTWALLLAAAMSGACLALRRRWRRGAGCQPASFRLAKQAGWRPAPQVLYKQRRCVMRTFSVVAKYLVKPSGIFNLFGLAVLAGLASLLVAGLARASDPLPVATLALPAPDVNAYSTNFRYDSQGVLYAWDGFHVLRYDAANSHFNTIGTVVGGTDANGPYNCADAGPINFSADGTEILLGNGGGGQAWLNHPTDTWHANRIWSMPILGGQVSTPVTTIPGHFDFVPVLAGLAGLGSDAGYFVDQGQYAGGVSSSSVSVFDKAKGTNVTVIDHVPGSSASIAVNPQGDRLYVGVGYDPTHRGDIYSFSLSQIASACSSGTPLGFLGGDFFNPTATNNQSGSGIFFDKDGYLFAGGGEGITCFRPDGTLSKTLAAGDPFSTTTTLVYDPAKDQVLAVVQDWGNGGVQTGAVYNARDFETAPEPATLVLLLSAFAMAATWYWRRRRP
jgi:hypothetical protein